MAKEAYSYTSIPEEQIDHALPSQERRRVQCRLTGKTKKTKKNKILTTQRPGTFALHRTRRAYY